jgi:hypothetical protein
MKKPIIRWTIGNANLNSSYEILTESIKSIIKLYSNNFKYFVCYNEVKIDKINKIKKKFENVNFLEQNWRNCPINIYEPKIIENKTKQKLNGSFWKICPPRLSTNNHEIFLDNDLIFLRKPKIINEFLNLNNKNLIIQDSKIYLGKFEKLIKNEKQGYNSGVFGLHPGYNFEKEIINNIDILDLSKEKNLSYEEEQGLLMYTLCCTNPLIGASDHFVGIHAEKVYLNSISDKFFEYKLEKIKDVDKNKFVKIDMNIIKKIFSEAFVVHFLESNRKEHKAWKYFRLKKCII